MKKIIAIAIMMLLATMPLTTVGAVSIDAVTELTYEQNGELNASILVDPTENIGIPIFQDFTINVTVANITDLFSYEFKLVYNNTILNATDAIIPTDHFLKPNKPGNIFLVDPGTINQSSGKVAFAATLLGDESGKNGSGTLATIKFHVIGKGECYLVFNDTVLVDSKVTSMENINLVNGYFITLFHDIAITSVESSAHEAILGEMIDIDVNVTNEGSGRETFNVTAYHNSTLIGKQKITLAFRASKTLTFDWNTTEVSWGNHTIKAEADIIPEETDTKDNTFIDGIVKLRSPPKSIFTYERTGSVGNLTMMSFNATKSYDPDGTIMNYTWNFGDETPIVVQTKPLIAHNFTDGTYNVTLVVTDEHNLTDSTTSTLIARILSGSIEDVVVTYIYLSNTTLDEPTSFIIIADNYRIHATYENKGSKGPVSFYPVFRYTNEKANLTIPITPEPEEPTMLEPGEEEEVYYMWATNASDLQHLSWYKLQGTASNNPNEWRDPGPFISLWQFRTYARPVANFTYQVDDMNVTFNSTSSYAFSGDLIEAYHWDFGDNTSATVDSIIAHEYGGPGTYEVTLTVYDIHGVDGVITIPVDIFLKTDLNKDRMVNIIDIAIVAQAYKASLNETDGLYWHDPPCEYCPHTSDVDFNKDGKVNILDITKVAIDYGKTY
jgi:PKD repeat protein